MKAAKHVTLTRMASGQVGARPMAYFFGVLAGAAADQCVRAGLPMPRGCTRPCSDLGGLCFGGSAGMGLDPVLGTFLTEPTDVPPNVLAYVAAQLGIRDGVAVMLPVAVRPAQFVDTFAPRKRAT